jgi:hypothetical protein
VNLRLDEENIPMICFNQLTVFDYWQDPRWDLLMGHTGTDTVPADQKVL